MQSRCAKHLFEGAEDRCGKCGFEYCGECLVYAFGPKKPPLCIPCAVAAAGIRAAAGNRPGYSKNDMKRFQKERASAFKRFRREKSNPPAIDEPELPEPPAPVVPMQPAAADVPMIPMLPIGAAPLAEPEAAPWPIDMADIEKAVPDAPPAAQFFEDDFTTDPAYIDPTPSSIPISGF